MLVALIPQDAAYLGQLAIVAAWMTRIGGAITLVSVILISPNAFDKKRINRGRKTVKSLASKAKVVLARVGRRFVVSLLFLAVAIPLVVFDPDSQLPLLSVKHARTILHILIIAGFVVPAGFLAAALVVGFAVLALWFLAHLLWLATSKRARLIRTGGILAVLGACLIVGATFVP
jgi:hypothetical protein